MKKYLALILAAALLLSMAAGCALTKDKDKTDGDDLDLTAVVAQVGDETVILGDVKDLYDYIISMYTAYGYDLAEDSETKQLILDDIVNNLTEAAVLTAKAKELGYDTFDGEQQAEFDSRVQMEIEDMLTYYRAQAEEEAADDPSIDVEARIQELVIEEAVYNMGDEDATYDAYIEYLKENVKQNFMQELLQADQLANIALTEAQIQEEYGALLTEQMALYAENPEAYKGDMEYYEMYGESPVVYAPEGYSRILHIFISMEDGLPDEYEANANDMALIEEEYGKLAFAAALGNGEEGDDARMQDMIAEYKKLSAANEALYEAYVSGARDKANDLYSQLQGGADFAALAKAESSPDDYSDFLIYTEKGILIATEYECDYDWSDVVKAEFAKLSVGEYSPVFEDADGYHIIFYLADEPAGEIGLDNVQEGIRAYLIEDIRAQEWDAIVDAWMNDGSVTLHEDVYKQLIGG